MEIKVILVVEKRHYKGKTHSYWYLRWLGSDGKKHGKSLGRVEKYSKRQAEKLRQAKENELSERPGRRDVGRAPELGAFLEEYYASRRGEISEGTMDLHRQTGRYLIGYFGAGHRIDQIGPREARNFKTALSEGNLGVCPSIRSEATQAFANKPLVAPEHS
jgi:hypothetical protein